MTIVVGSVPYLNARPLIRWFDTEDGRRSNVQVIEETPAVLSQMLDAGQIDAALVSVFASFVQPKYIVLPGVSISGQDEIKSVRVFARLPFRMLHSIAMDTSSLTSAALVRILLAELYDSHPEPISYPPDLDRMLSVADAALLIGDPGMLASAVGLRTLDLGEAWRKLTGLPFTYAVWLARPDVDISGLADILQNARDYGITQASAIAEDEAVRLGCAFEVCYDYITRVMDYNLSDEHYGAIKMFHQKCKEHALLTR